MGVVWALPKAPCRANSFSMMKNSALSFLIGFLSLCSPAFAQETANVPASQEQVRLSYAPLVKKVSPAVINIYTKRIVTTRAVSPFMNDPFFSQFFGQGFGVPQQRLESSLGSGVILDAAGLAVTNAHVVKGAEEITVILSDGREFGAEIKLVDEASDLALLQIDAKGETLPTATLQPSENLEVGDLVLAIGNPFGVGQTVTSGIVSALARSSLNINDFNFFIQTDAAINPGNSGGPLVSMDGGVIGINSAIYSKDGGSLGIGFAIPSEMVATVMAAAKAGQVDKNGGVIRPWVGISVQDVTSDISDSLGMARPTGALISSLHAASPAREAGLKPGDVVTAVNGHKVGSGAELRFRLSMVPLGQGAKLSYLRKGTTSETVMKAITPPDIPARGAVTIGGRTPLSGALLVNLNPAVGVELGIKESPDEGVVVLKVDRGSIAERVVRPGDFILSVNGTDIKAPADAEKALGKPSPRGWVLEVVSGGQKRTLMIR
jgi:Do/DeqQ family serine protease